MSSLGRLIVFSAPSGSGKTTIVRQLLQDNALNLSFSISATSRAPRANERNTIDYFFLSPQEFRAKIDSGDFLEWEEVYPEHFYGTLLSHVNALREKGINVIFDVDVKGGLAIKKAFPQETLALFVMPPSIQELQRRLESRGTDAPEKISMRLAKAAQEIEQSANFDHSLINDDLTATVAQAKTLIINHIN
ncbi:MAG: guanylate kinase [Flavobacteriaceae bacterium]|nr:guanylate kinase [Flavobacteriaceae bacterium]